MIVAGCPPTAVAGQAGLAHKLIGSTWGCRGKGMTVVCALSGAGAGSLSAHPQVTLLFDNDSPVFLSL